ncbi:unnamed protein product [Linum trigynum]|uniref:Uncharacterized protein n=1 Tax=Linum trigynum TaxID=586398 RepID=A0AAV2GY92_9ROSI
MYKTEDVATLKGFGGFIYYIDIRFKDTLCDFGYNGDNLPVVVVASTQIMNGCCLNFTTGDFGTTRSGHSHPILHQPNQSRYAYLFFPFPVFY